MNKAVFALFLSVTIYSGSLRAEDAPVPPPSAPFVKTPPPGSAWAVKIKWSDSEKPKKPEPAAPASAAAPKKSPEVPVQLEVKCGRNGVTAGQISYSDGRQETYYVSDGSVLLLAENTGKPFTRSLQMSENDACSLEVAHFPGTSSWIGHETYKGPDKKDGVVCWHYALALRMGLELQAWIRTDNSYPAEVDIKTSGAGTYVYHFDPVSDFPADVPLPDKYRDALTQVTTLKAALDALRQANQAQK